MADDAERSRDDAADEGQRGPGARPIWKGAVSFGLVTIPVGMYSATERKESLSFHLLHETDRARVQYKRVCTAEGIEVPWSEIVKGYEYDKGQYVVMTDEDFARARTPATEAFDIQVFVDAHEVEDLSFDEPYYLAPQGRAARKAYALLRDALKAAGKIGVGTIVMRQREHLAALEPVGEALALITMRFAQELRSPNSLGLPKEGQGWNQKEMALTRQLVDAFAAKWDPTRFKDTYTEILKQAIQQKIEGKEISVPGRKRPAKVISLTEALKASLKTARNEPVKARSRAQAGRRRGRRTAA